MSAGIKNIVFMGDDRKLQDHVKHRYKQIFHVINIMISLWGGVITIFGVYY